MTPIKLLLICLLLWIPAVAGCGARMDIPAGFVSLDSPGRYDCKATSADGVMLAARRLDNRKGGTLAFWSQAVGNELLNDGYRPQGDEDVKSSTGRAGKLLTFAKAIRGKDFIYMTALFVNDGAVLLAEAGGAQPTVEKHAEQLRAALLSVK